MTPNPEQLISECCSAAMLDDCLHDCKYHCSKCLKPCTARKNAFGLDGFLAGAERAGEILDEKEKTASDKLHYCGTRPEYCGRCRTTEKSASEKTRICPNGFHIKQPCHCDEKSAQDSEEPCDNFYSANEFCQGCGWLKNLHSKLPPPQSPMEGGRDMVSQIKSLVGEPIASMIKNGEQEDWDIEFDKRFLSPNYQDAWNRSTYEAGPSVLKAFISRTVKEAYERGRFETIQRVIAEVKQAVGIRRKEMVAKQWTITVATTLPIVKEVYRGEIPSDPIAAARAERTKEIVEMVKNHVTQNTYEGDEALVYQTTLKEIIARLTSPEA